MQTVIQTGDATLTGHCAAQTGGWSDSLDLETVPGNGSCHTGPRNPAQVSYVQGNIACYFI